MTEIDCTEVRRPKGALEVAIDQNNELEVRRIMAHDKTFDDVKNERFHRGRTVMHWAAYNDYRLTARALIARGVKVNVYTDGQRTPLHFACEYGHVELAGILIENGAYIDMMDKYWQTPLIAAVENDHIEVAMLLIENGANVIIPPCSDFDEWGEENSDRNLTPEIIEILELRIEKRAEVAKRAIARDKVINDKEMKFIEILKGK